MKASTEGTVVLIRLSECITFWGMCAATPVKQLVLNKVQKYHENQIQLFCTQEANRLIEKRYREFLQENGVFFYKRHAYTTFHCPVNQMAESNYIFSGG